MICVEGNASLDKKVSGVLAAVPTPFDSDFEPDFDLFMEHCEWALAEGCNGLNVLGSTGEANSQSAQVRAEIMQAVAATSLRNHALMVGTGTPALGDTIELTALAAGLGFDAALILAPYYYVPVSDDGLFDYFSCVINAISDSDIGIYLYNFPQMTGITFSPQLVGRLIEAYPNHMRGMKDSSGDLEYAQHMSSTYGAVFDVFPGSEAPLPDAVKYGYAGCVSASVNATAALAARIWQHRDAPAEQDVIKLRALRAEIQSVPMAAAVKTLVAQRTGDAEWLRMLPPLSELNAADRSKIEAVGRQLGFSD